MCGLAYAMGCSNPIVSPHLTHDDGFLIDIAGFLIEWFLIDIASARLHTGNVLIFTSVSVSNPFVRIIETSTPSRFSTILNF